MPTEYTVVDVYFFNIVCYPNKGVTSQLDIGDFHFDRSRRVRSIGPNLTSIANIDLSCENNARVNGYDGYALVDVQRCIIFSGGQFDRCTFFCLFKYRSQIRAIRANDDTGIIQS